MLLQSSIQWCAATSSVLALGLLGLFLWKQRQDRAVDDLSKQVWRLTRDPDSAGRIRLDGRRDAISDLGLAVNKLLESLEHRGIRLQEREQLFQRLVDSVHEAVLVHREVILFANSRFLALLGTTAKGFTVKEVSADKAYGSAANFKAVESHGGQFFPAFKNNATGACGGCNRSHPGE